MQILARPSSSSKRRAAEHRARKQAAKRPSQPTQPAALQERKLQLLDSRLKPQTSNGSPEMSQ
jgi:hypothetical protein